MGTWARSQAAILAACWMALAGLATVGHPDPVCKVGAYSVGLVSIARVREFDKPKEQQLRTVITLLVEAEEEAAFDRVARLAKDPIAIGSAGEKLKFLQVSPDRKASGALFGRYVQVSFAPESSQARRIRAFQASILCFDQKNSFRVDFPLPPPPQGVAEQVRGIGFQLHRLGVALNDQQQEVYQAQLSLQISPKLASPIFQGETGWCDEAIYLVDDQGDAYPATSSTHDYQYLTDQEGKQLLVGMRISVWFPPLAKNRKPKSLSYLVNRLRGLHSLPYRFTDILLP